MSFPVSSETIMQPKNNIKIQINQYYYRILKKSDIFGIILAGGREGGGQNFIIRGALPPVPPRASQIIFSSEI